MAAKIKRPKMSTKDELMAYLNENQNIEFPFNDKVWAIAVAKTADKERQFKVMQTTDFDGNTKTLKVPNGSINPVSKYFQLVALPQYQNCEEPEREAAEYDGSDVDKMLDELENTDENLFIKELVSIYFSTVKGDNFQFVVDRLSDYYSNYEFNEGSDKFLVVSAVSDELTLRELYEKRTRGSDNEVKIEKVKKGYLSTLEGLRLLKKQGSKLDEGKNKFTIFVDELEKSGELKFHAESYPQDQIDELIDATRLSIVRAFSNG